MHMHTQTPANAWCAEQHLDAFDAVKVYVCVRAMAHLGIHPSEAVLKGFVNQAATSLSLLHIPQLAIMVTASHALPVWKLDSICSRRCKLNMHG